MPEKIAAISTLRIFEYKFNDVQHHWIAGTHSLIQINLYR